MQPKPHILWMCVRWKYLQYILNIFACVSSSFCGGGLSAVCRRLSAHFPLPFLLMWWQLCWPQCDEKQLKYDHVGGTASDAFHQFRSTNSYIEVAIFDSAFQVTVQRIRCCVGSWVQGNSLNPCFVAREDPSVQMWGFAGLWVTCWHSGIRPFTEFDRVSHTYLMWRYVCSDLVFWGKWFDGQSLNGPPVGTVDIMCIPSNFRSVDTVNLPSFQLSTNSSI